MSEKTCWIEGLGLEVRFRQVGEVRTRCLEQRGKLAAGALPVIVLHGIEASAENHIRNLAALAQVGDVIAPDLLGHGMTDRPAVEYDLADYGQHVLALADTLEIPRFSLVGQSLGGWIGCWLAREAPERIGSLVLNTTAGLPVVDEAGWQAWARLREVAAEAARTLDPGLVRRRLEWVVKDKASITDEIVDLRRTMWSLPGWRDVAEQVLGLLTPERYVMQELNTEWLRSIGAPTLLVWTEDNPIHGVPAARAAANQISDSELAVIADAAHWPQFEQPASYNRIVTDFLTRRGSIDPGGG